MSSSISSGECTCRCPVFFTRISFSSRLPLPLRKSIDHANACWDHCIGTTVHIAVRVGSCSASDFGHELADDHRQRRQDQQDDDGRGGLGGLGLQAADPLDERGETRRDRGLGVGAENQAGEGDADLRGGDVAVERVRVFEDRAGPGPRGRCRPRPAVATGSGARPRRRTPPPRTAPSAGSAG